MKCFILRDANEYISKQYSTPQLIMKLLYKAVILTVILASPVFSQSNDYSSFPKNEKSFEDNFVSQKKIYSFGINKAWRRSEKYPPLVIKTDPYSGKATEVAPFDRPFQLTIRKPKTKDSKSLSIKEVNLKPLLIGETDELMAPDEIKAGGDTSKHVVLEIGTLRPWMVYEVNVKWADGEADIKETFHLTTTDDKLAERIGQRITSQFGVAVPFFKSGGNVRRSTPLLLLTLYYHPRPINSKVAMRAYQLWAPQRFSIMAGVSLTSIKVNGYREDLLGKNNLMLGIGYQPAEILRVSYGLLAFKEVHPDPSLSARRTIRFTPYIGLSLDIKLKDIFGGIFTTLGFN